MSEQPGGGFFRKVGSLFYENEPDSGEPVTPAQAPLTHAGNSHPVNCAADPEIVKRIEVALKLAGANALASVLDLCESMASIIPDETTRFKAALAAAKKQGASATVIVADFDRAEQALTAEEQRFGEESDHAAKEQVDKRQSRIDAARGQAETKRAQIDALSSQIEALRTGSKADLDEVARLESEIESKKTSIEATRASFKTSIDHVRADLATKKSLITKLIKE